MKLLQRLQALETAAPAKPTRQFIGYKADDRYFENVNAPINYRNGLDPSQTTGQAFTKADLAELERQGFEIQLISIVYQSVDMGDDLNDSV